MLMSLFVLGLGILALAVFFVWKPHVKEPQVSVERKRYPIKPDVKVEEVVEPQIAVVQKPKSRATPEAKPPRPRYCVSVASCKKRANAESLVNELKVRGYTASVKEVTMPGRGTWYRVTLGPFSSQQGAQAVARKFEETQGMECFVTLTE